MPAYHTCNDLVNLNLRRSRSSRRGSARIVRRNVVRQREKKRVRPTDLHSSDRATKERKRERMTATTVHGKYTREKCVLFAEGDKLGTHDDVNRYQETAGNVARSITAPERVTYAFPRACRAARPRPLICSALLQLLNIENENASRLDFRCAERASEHTRGRIFMPPYGGDGGLFSLCSPAGFILPSDKCRLL